MRAETATKETTTTSVCGSKAADVLKTNLLFGLIVDEQGNWRPKPNEQHFLRREEPKNCNRKEMDDEEKQQVKEGDSGCWLGFTFKMVLTSICSGYGDWECLWFCFCFCFCFRIEWVSEGDISNLTLLNPLALLTCHWLVVASVEPRAINQLLSTLVHPFFFFFCLKNFNYYIKVGEYHKELVTQILFFLYLILAWNPRNIVTN